MRPTLTIIALICATSVLIGCKEKPNPTIMVIHKATGDTTYFYTIKEAMADTTTEWIFVPSGIYDFKNK